MATIFTKIINREIPASIVYEDADHIAFLDICPLTKGHTLVVPKLEVDELFELPEEVYNNLQACAFKIAKALKQTMPCKRVGVAVLGMEVPHAHIHLVPLQSEGDLNFKNNRLSFSKEEMDEITKVVSEAVGFN